VNVVNLMDYWAAKFIDATTSFSPRTWHQTNRITIIANESVNFHANGLGSDMYVSDDQSHGRHP